jgi:hypothetical protein
VGGAGRRSSLLHWPIPVWHRWPCGAYAEGGALVVEYATVCFRSQEDFGPAVPLSSIGPAHRIRKRGIPHRKSEQVLAFPHDPETARGNL